MQKTNVTVGEFYEFLKGGFEGNNSVYKVEATLYDGTKPVKITFETPEGFQEDQRQRVGKLEMDI